MDSPIDVKLEELREKYREERARGGKRLWIINLQARVLKTAQRKFSYKVEQGLIYGRQTKIHPNVGSMEKEN